MKGKQKSRRTRSFLVIGLVLLSLFGARMIFDKPVAWAANAPAVITYQGKLLVNGVAASTSQQMYFILYDDLTAGSALYTASGTVGAETYVSVTPSSGLFSVDLGGTGTNTLDPTIFQNTSTIYLEVRVGGTTLSPRKQISAAPYAFNAKYLDGVAASSTSPASEHLALSDSSGNFDFNNVTSTGIYVNGGGFWVNGTTGGTQTSGAGTRLMWIPSKSAFRAGEALDTEWDDANVGASSFAFGYNVTSSGQYSTALGLLSTASGLGSISIGGGYPGLGTQVSSNVGSIAIGIINTASGIYSSMAIGFTNTASGETAMAIGSNNTSGGTYSISMGRANTSLGTASIAIGSTNQVIDSYAGAFGYLNYATGTGAFAWGTNNIASSTDSFVFGKNLSATAEGAFVFGSGFGSSNALINNTANSLMIGFKSQVPTVYVGPSPDAASSGKVGIGTADPGFKLTIDSDGGILAKGTLYSGADLTTTIGGTGSMLIWYPKKGYFRTGYVSNDQLHDSTKIGDYGVAMGYDTQATNSSSVALGESSSSTGRAAVALGYSNTASGDYSLATGYGSTASGANGSAAMGYYSQATGAQGATAIGYYAKANATSSIALGTLMWVTGQNSIGLNASSTTASLTQDNTIALVGGNVGVGTVAPSDRLHVTGGGFLASGTTGATPVSGAGTRLMWVPTKNALRAGIVFGTQWDDDNIGVTSFAFGQDAVASNAYSIAMGTSVTSSGEVSMAFGLRSIASGNSSFVFGTDAIANNTYAMALGASTTASGSNSLAAGYLTTASGQYATTFGQSTIASGTAAIAFGRSNIAGGSYAAVFGYNSQANGTESFAFGDQLIVSGDYSFGIALDAGGYTVSNSGVLAIMGGNVGIGTTSPAYRLDVVGADDNVARFRNATLNTTCALTAETGIIVCTSDERLKTNIENMSGSLEKINQLRTVAYNWKADPDNPRKNYGFIAQEVENILPTLVSTDEAGIKSMSMIGMIPFAIQAIQEQQQQIEALKNLLSVNGSGGNINGSYAGDTDISGLAGTLLSVNALVAKDNKWEIDGQGRFITRLTTAGGTKEMYAMQSPTSEFVFSGSAQLAGGEARVEFDSSTQEIIDASEPLKVSVTLTSGGGSGVYVAEKTAQGFLVKELNGGTGSATFDWMVVAKRRLETAAEDTPAGPEQNNAGGEGNPLDEQITPPVEDAINPPETTEEPAVEGGATPTENSSPPEETPATEQSETPPANPSENNPTSPAEPPPSETPPAETTPSV